jgi:hypothetical protein
MTISTSTQHEAINIFVISDDHPKKILFEQFYTQRVDDWKWLTKRFIFFPRDPTLNKFFFFILALRVKNKQEISQ